MEQLLTEYLLAIRPFINLLSIEKGAGMPAGLLGQVISEKSRKKLPAHWVCPIIICLCRTFGSVKLLGKTLIYNEREHLFYSFLENVEEDRYDMDFFTEEDLFNYFTDKYLNDE